MDFGDVGVVVWPESEEREGWWREVLGSRLSLRRVRPSRDRSG